VRVPGFCGGSCPEASLNASAERSRNIYPHIIGGGTPPSNPVMYRIPGLALFVALTGGITRGCFEINGRAFAAAGDKIYEVASTGVATLLGTVDSDDDPVTWASNGTAGGQVMFTSGGTGYILNLAAATITAITAAGFPQGNAKMCGFVDGYFVVLNSVTGAFQISALDNGLVWDALDIGEVSTHSDKVVALITNDRQIWLFGGQTTSIWYNNGDDLFPFAPINLVLQQGIEAPYSAARADNTVFWVGKNEHGARVLYRGQQGTPLRVSTHAIEHIWTSYETLSDAVAYVEQWEGHVFYHLYIPSAEDAPDNDNAVSWVYDVATKQWHERALWSTTTGEWSPAVGRCHMHVFEKHLIGDRRTGALYEQRTNYYTFELVTV
jgi:hypothetical protein